MARTPLYKKSETEMLKRIKSGKWAVDLRLPNEFILAEEFGVSQGTMRRALITLEQMGHLKRTPGRGTIVSEAPKTPTPTPTTLAGVGFDRLIGADGQPAQLEVFRDAVKDRKPENDEHVLFGAERVHVITRTLKQGGERFALDEIIISQSVLPELVAELAPDLPGLLDQHSLSPAQIDDQLTALLCTMSQSVALAIDRNTALQKLERVAKDSDGKVLAKQTLLYVGGQVGYAISLSA
ncbi:MAG: GntR family transcriptional regulator [Paracoccaceae bacterium]|jgi:GntR family transcriptional regulator